MQLVPPKAPSLPLAPREYAAQGFEEHNNLLRKYFNTLDAVMQQVLLGFNHYGCFHQTADVTAAAANTAYPISFDLTHHAYGISVSGADITVTVGGVYMLAFNTELAATAGSNHYGYFWVRINDVDETYSANRVAVDTSRDRVAGWTYQLELQAGDVVTLMWSVSDNRVFLNARAATAPVPAISAAVLNIVWMYPASFG
jgi:hypothetical protein